MDKAQQVKGILITIFIDPTGARRVDNSYFLCWHVKFFGRRQNIRSLLAKCQHLQSPLMMMMKDVHANNQTTVLHPRSRRIWLAFFALCTNKQGIGRQISTHQPSHLVIINVYTSQDLCLGLIKTEYGGQRVQFRRELWLRWCWIENTAKSTMKSNIALQIISYLKMPAACAICSALSVVSGCAPHRF